MFGFFQRRRHEKILAQVFPEAWREILLNRFPLFRILPGQDKAELEQLIQIFLAEKLFEGCDGLVLTDEIKVTIAAQACLLLLHRETEIYPELRSILVYPSSYQAKSVQHSGSGIVSESDSHRLGESWGHGTVVLAWDSVARGVININDGQNVALHEFAHQLDQEDGLADGRPEIKSEVSFAERRARYLTWARVLSAEYEALCEKAEGGRKSVLDHYGATNPAEFFAVASECFFEKPLQMQRKHPELYEEFKKFYHQDPASWRQREIQ